MALDGNSKLHRRTCGMPYAEVVPVKEVNKQLLRGCSLRPCGRDTLCAKHAACRDEASSSSATIAKHRLKKALHTSDDVCHLEVQLENVRNWQPAVTVRESVLSQYFASLADRNIRQRLRFFLLFFQTIW